MKKLLLIRHAKAVHDLSYDDFIADNKTIDAVVRNFEIIGEAASRLPDEFKDGHPEIDWHKLRGLRNRIVHHYFGIDHKINFSITIFCGIKMHISHRLYDLCFC